MGLSCGAKTAKLLLFIFNVIFFLCGVALLAIGIWVAVDKSKLMQLAAQALGPDNAVNNQLNTGSLVQYGAYVIIAVGVFNFVVGFCGCCGACTENKCLLGVYAVLIGIVMIIEIVGAIIAGVYHKDVENNLKNGLLRLQNTSYVGLPKGSENNTISLAFDIIMITVKCCGIDSFEDFTKDYQQKADKWYRDGRKDGSTTLTIPYSCCKMKDTKFLAEGKYTDIKNNLENAACGRTAPAGDYYTVGCYNAIRSKIVKYAAVIIGVAIAIVFIELLGIILACCLIRAIDE